jgi:hypothetical protein
MEIIDVLGKSLADADIEVVSPRGPNDTVTICTGGTLSEEARKSLRDNLNIDGLFVGTLEQRRVEPLLLTRFRLELIGNPSGKLIWTTKVKLDQLATWAGTKATATGTTELALESFRKELLGHSRETKSMTEKKGR